MLLVLPIMMLLASCGPDQPSSSPVEPDPVDTSSSTEVPPAPSSDSSEEPPAPSSESSEEPPVLNPSVTITAPATQVYITKQITMTANIVDSTDSVVWTSSDTKKATVEGGVVTAVAPGEVTITASLSGDATVKDEVKITVLDTILDATVNGSAWDFSKLYQADPVVQPVAASTGNTDDIKTYAAFKNATGKQYVAKAHFELIANGDWVWNTVTIGHINGDGLIYATGFSQGTKKLITQFSKTVGGFEQQWGVVSDRSQIWSQHDLVTLDVTNGIDITAVRDNGDFYFFINGELYWKEGVAFNDFDEIDTTPVIYLNGADVKASNLYVTTDSVKVAEEAAKGSAKFYPTYAANVEISEDQKTIKFKNADRITANNKDVAAKSIGDAALFPANKETKVEFDLVVDAWGSLDSNPAVCLDMKRYDSDTLETRTFQLQQTGVTFAGWSYGGDMPGGFPAGETKYNNGTNDVKLSEEKTYHVALTRLMYAGEGEDTKIEVFDGETQIVSATHGWKDGYSGNSVAYFSVRNVNATLSNITFTVAE